MIAALQPSTLTRGYVVGRRDFYIKVSSALTLPQLGMRRSERHTRQLGDARGAAGAANRAKSRLSGSDEP